MCTEPRDPLFVIDNYNLPGGGHLHLDAPGIPESQDATLYLTFDHKPNQWVGQMGCVIWGRGREIGVGDMHIDRYLSNLSRYLYTTAPVYI